MLFTDPPFLFLFLPIVLGVYYLSPRWMKNLILLVFSILFYAVGEQYSTLVILFSIVFNYLVGLWIDRNRLRGSGQLAFGITINLLLLISFKYAHFIVENLDVALVWLHIHPIPPPKVHLPIGISFFTFHAISYITDVWRKEVKAMRELTSFALYITLFPQLIAGPIIRYKTICDQFEIDGARGRRHTWDGFAEGIRRFILGFGKKMLIANTVAITADTAFKTDPHLITSGLAWLGVLCYTLQINFDFSGYSDMAIGLGKMFGFTFPENFNYPYIATSITDFWRRWHMSLSNWFRDYLYIPLGGNRAGRGRMYFNLLIVFFLCGLWHGAMWTFVAWGLFHGLFLIIERIGLGHWMGQRSRIFRHGYTLLIVMISWVLFRADSIQLAGQYLLRMAFVTAGTVPAYTVTFVMSRTLLIAIAAGLLGSVPMVPGLRMMWDHVIRTAGGWKTIAAELAGRTVELGALAMIFLASTAMSAANTYNPFIYFRF